jgi:hypothetical protein
MFKDLITFLINVIITFIFELGFMLLHRLKLIYVKKHKIMVEYI